MFIITVSNFSKLVIESHYFHKIKIIEIIFITTLMTDKDTRKYVLFENEN